MTCACGKVHRHFNEINGLVIPSTFFAELSEKDNSSINAKEFDAFTYQKIPVGRDIESYNLDAEKNSFLAITVGWGNIPIVKELAIKHFQFLILRPLNVGNINGLTPLHLAACLTKNSYEMTALLIEYNAEINAKREIWAVNKVNNVLEYTGQLSPLPIELALEKNNLATAILLYRHGFASFSALSQKNILNLKEKFHKIFAKYRLLLLSKYDPTTFLNHDLARKIVGICMEILKP